MGDGSEVRRYHDRTKHTWESVRRGGVRLDWARRPDLFKHYRDGERIPLPDSLPEHPVPALDVLLGREPERTGDRPGLDEAGGLAFGELARLLRFGAGVIRSREVGGERYHFRTYSSAGALYPVEVYAASPDAPGLDAGLYHFHPLELSLRRLRGGDAPGALAAATGDPGVAGAFLALTGVLGRSAWKYGARAYRHLFWDAGTMLANLLALAASAGLSPRVHVGFVDQEVNRLLGAEEPVERTLALLALGGAPTGPAGPLGPLEATPVPDPRSAEPYPEADAAHDASTLREGDAVRAWRDTGRLFPGRDDPAASQPGGPRVRLSRDPLEAVIRRRGSARDYVPDPVPAAEAAALLDCAAAPVPADFPAICETFLVANAVAGLESGLYRYAGGRFELLRAGDFRARAARLCLEQPLAGRAALTAFLMADLERVLGALGDRGYRAAQLEAGLRAGRVTLAAYAQGLGATPLTFYDDEITAFVGRPALSPLLCVTVGVDARRPGLRRRSLA